jgi:putative ATP-dependent DNA ligase
MFEKTLDPEELPLTDEVEDRSISEADNARIESVADGQSVGETHTVRGDPTAVDDFLAHLRDCDLPVTVEADRRENGDRVVTFRKEMLSTEDKIRNYLNGHVVTE